MKPTLEMTKQSDENQVVYKVSNETPRSNKLLYACLGFIMILLAVLMVFTILTYNETKGSDSMFITGVHVNRETGVQDMSAANPKFAAFHVRAKRCSMCCGGEWYPECEGLTCSC